MTTLAQNESAAKKAFFDFLVAKYKRKIKKGEIVDLDELSHELVPYEDDEIIEAALRILDSRMRRDKFLVTNCESSIKYLRLRMQHLEHEIFACLFLDTRHYVIDYVEMFRGTIDGASVHPREIAKEALARNAAAVILVHNHPSGVAEPSSADIALTKRVKDALGLVDIRVLDHIIIADDKTVSLAEEGRL